jgi:hypothetical protein
MKYALLALVLLLACAPAPRGDRRAAVLCVQADVVPVRVYEGSRRVMTFPQSGCVAIPQWIMDRNKTTKLCVRPAASGVCYTMPEETYANAKRWYMYLGAWPEHTWDRDVETLRAIEQ